MATPAGAAPAAAEPPNPILDVFFSPSAAMDSLARKPRFLLPLIIVTIIGTATMVIALQKGVIEHGMRQKMETNPRFDQIPAERREAIIEQSAKFGSYTVIGGAVIGPTMGLLLTSGVLLLLTNVVVGAKVRFQQVMAVVSHSWMPLAISHGIAIPILLAKEPDTVDFQNIVVANLSFLFSPTEQHRLYMIATSIDLFSFWVIGLLALGLARLSGKGTGTALAIILIPWALYVAIFKAWLG